MMLRIFVCNLKENYGYLLKIGQIFAVNQSDGNSPVFSDCLKITSNIGAISVQQLLSIYGEIPSGPWA